MSQAEKGEHRRSYVYEPCDIRSCSTAAAAAVLPLLHCADAFDSEEVWFGTFPRCGQDGTPTYYAKTHAEAPARSCHKTKTFKYGYCYSVAATAHSDKSYGVMQAHSSSSSSSSSSSRSRSSRQQAKMRRAIKLNGTSVLETVPGSYCCRILQ